MSARAEEVASRPLAALVLARSVWRARAVVRALVGRELRARYVGSTLGVVWSLAHPLLQLATFTFVFATVLKVRATPADGGDVPFVLYLACGLFPWLAVQEGILRSTTCVVENPSLVKRVVFPVETLPVQLVLTATIHQLIATSALVLLMAALGFPPRLSLLAFPALLAAQCLLTIGLGWAAAALHVLFRDTAQMLGVLLPIWFYLTPVIYPYHLVPAFLQPLLALNPLTPLVEGYRDVMLYGRMPAAGGSIWLASTSVLVFVAGAAIFQRARGELADLV